ncbi:MAG: methyltransferase domain-containing protein [Myxococcaceae bacterium]|nr:methyltransferase domain-containing protein [Myxococcaceae bacterium]
MSRIPLRPDKAGETLATLEAPPDWRAVFGREGPLELEIGCGAGGFALEHCRRHPHVNYVAFEWRKKYAREVAHRAEKHGLTHLKVIEADARTVVPKLFAPGSLDVIHLQFPDPWWKRAHFKRAILLPDFTRFLLGLLKPKGRFDFRTDVEERARQGLAVLEQAGFHNPLGPGAFHPYDPEEAPSTRERRYLVTGQPVYRARLVKPG